VYRASNAWAPHVVTIAALFRVNSLLRSSNCVWAAQYEAGQSVSANGNEEFTGENCHSYISVVNAITLYSCTIKLPIYSSWGLLRVCAACPTPRLNQSYELRPPWEQYLRYVPHRVCNGYNRSISLFQTVLKKETSQTNACLPPLCYTFQSDTFLLAVPVSRRYQTKSEY